MGSYQRGSGAGSSPIPFIISPHPHSNTSGSTGPSRLLPWGSRLGEGKKFKSQKLRVGLGVAGGNGGDTRKGFSRHSEPGAHSPPDPR